jgi:hypothetical protein
VRFAPHETLAAWEALDPERLAEIRAEVEHGIELMGRASEGLGTPSCTPEAWKLPFVQQALDVADAGMRSAAPAGVYLDDVDAACVRFDARILGRMPTSVATADLYLFMSRTETEAGNLAGFLDRPDPPPDLAEVHEGLRDAAVELELEARTLAHSIVSRREASVEQGFSSTQAALTEVDAGF